MNLLDTTTRKLQIVLAGAKAANDCPWVASWDVVSLAGTATPAASANGTTNGTTAVDVVASPASGSYYELASFTINNADTAAITLIFRYNDNATVRKVFTITLAVGDNLKWGNEWEVRDSTGALKGGSALTKATVDALFAGGAAWQGQANTFTVGPNLFESSAASTPALVAKRLAGQSGSIFQIQETTGAIFVQGDGTGWYPGVDTTNDLGTSSLRWRNLYLANSPLLGVSPSSAHALNPYGVVISSIDNSTPAGIDFERTGTLVWSLSWYRSQGYIGFYCATAPVSAGFLWSLGDDNTTAGLVTQQVQNSATTTVTTAYILDHLSSGTAAAGFGSSFLWKLKSSTTASQLAAEEQALWATATHASRKGRWTVGAHDASTSAGSPRFGISIASSGSAALIQFFGTGSEVAQQTGDVAAGLVALGLFSSATYSASKAALSLYDHYADVNNTTTTETTLYSDGIGAAKLATNGDKIVAEFGGTFSGAVSATQQIRVYFGPVGDNTDTLVFDSGALAIGVASPSWDLVISAIRQSSSAVRVTASITTSSAALGATAKYTAVTGLTLTNSQFITVTGTAAGIGAGSNQITASMGYGQYCPAA